MTRDLTSLHATMAAANKASEGRRGARGGAVANVGLGVGIDGGAALGGTGMIRARRGDEMSRRRWQTKNRMNERTNEGGVATLRRPSPPHSHPTTPPQTPTTFNGNTPSVYAIVLSSLNPRTLNPWILEHGAVASAKWARRRVNRKR